MAGTKVSVLTAGAALGGTEAIPAVQSAATVKITADQIKTFVSASPTLVTPVLGVATGTSLALGDGTLASPALNFSSATGTGMYFGGGTNGVAFAKAGVLTGYFDSNSNWVLPTAGLLLSNNGTRITFGGSADLGLSRISAGVIGVGTGAQGSVAGGLQAATFTVGTNQDWSGAGGFNTYRAGSTSVILHDSSSVSLGSNLSFGWNSTSTGTTRDLFLSRAAAATLQHGAADSASPVAQTIKFQDVVAGTSNTAGVNATIQAPAGTGTGAGGSLIFQVAPAGSSGTAKNAWATALTIAGDRTMYIARDLEVFGGVLGVTSTQFNTYVTGAIGFTNSGTGKTSADTAFTRLSAGIIGVGTGAWGNTTGTLTATYLRTVGVTVSALPAAAAGNQGQRGFVTDATATTYLSTVAGGGANKVPVVSDGTNWIIG